MKNITVSVDDTTYRDARIAAARRDSSVSALVKEYLVSLGRTEASARGKNTELETLLSEIAARHPGFSCRDNLSREDLHTRR